MLVFGAAMFLIVSIFTRHEQSQDGYLLANRNMSVLGGALSIAVSWIWAPAIFFCSMKAYLDGIPGIFWFVVPSTVCFWTFAFVAIRMRRQLPSCYSMPDFISKKCGDSPFPHLASVLVVLVIDIVAVLFNTLVGAHLLHTLAEIPFAWGVVLMTGTPLAYSIWRGLPASVLTDVVQMSMILLLCFIIVPWVVFEAGGTSRVLQGLGGLSGRHRSLFETEVSFSWGIPASIALLCVPLADQMFYQRAFAARQGNVWRTFLLAGLLYCLVPITLSLLGFLGANPEVNRAITEGGRQIEPLMINVSVVANFLPQWTVVAFAVMAICAMSSTLDSAYCAISSILTIDIYQKYISPQTTNKNSIRFAQIVLGLIAIFSSLLVIFVPLKGEWLFNINGSVAECVVIPILVLLFGKKTSSSAIGAAIMVPFVLVVPFAIYANIIGNPLLIVLTMGTVLFVSAFTYLLISKYTGNFIET